MTRKDYKLIAKALVLIEDRPTRALVADTLSAVLQDDNKAFDQDRFLKACGLPS